MLNEKKNQIEIKIQINRIFVKLPKQFHLKTFFF